jgi:hypothetical protein
MSVSLIKSNKHIGELYEIKKRISKANFIRENMKSSASMLRYVWFSNVNSIIDVYILYKGLI